jgi:ATP-binding cassette subfamily G (WHITE) protein 2
MPLNVLPSLVFGIIIYWLAHLNPDPSVFGEFLGIMILHSLASMTLGLAVSAISPSTEAAIALGAPIVIIMLLFGGFYINIDSLPIVANLIPYIAYLKWTFE